MSDKKHELQNLLKNIQLGLQKYSVSELNDAIVLVLANKPDQQQEINYILQIVADKYKITQKTLVTSRARGDFQLARMLSYCLLHYTLGLSVRHIGDKIFHRGHNCVSSALKHYKALEPERFKVDREFEEKHKECQSEFINLIKPNHEQQ